MSENCLSRRLRSSLPWCNICFTRCFVGKTTMLIKTNCTMSGLLVNWFGFYANLRMDWFYHSLVVGIWFAFCSYGCNELCKTLSTLCPFSCQEQQMLLSEAFIRQKCTHWWLYGGENISQLQLAFKPFYYLQFMLIRSTIKFSLCWWTVANKAHKTCRVISVCSVTLDCVANEWVLTGALSYTYSLRK